jgi:hypothetical protein
MLLGGRGSWTTECGQCCDVFLNQMRVVHCRPQVEIVHRAFNDLMAARAHAGKASTNAELERLRQEDQADREGEIDNAKMQRMIQNDPIRRARVVDLIAAGVLATGRDFHNASLIMQHGRGVDDFRLAHELSICAVALGDSTAAGRPDRSG